MLTLGVRHTDCDQVLSLRTGAGGVVVFTFTNPAPLICLISAILLPPLPEIDENKIVWFVKSTSTHLSASAFWK